MNCNICNKSCKDDKKLLVQQIKLQIGGLIGHVK